MFATGQGGLSSECLAASSATSKRKTNMTRFLKGFIFKDKKQKSRSRAHTPVF
jgi:hypothetical protein